MSRPLPRSSGVPRAQAPTTTPAAGTGGPRGHAPARREFLHGRSGRIRIGPWQGQDQIAQIAPLDGNGPCSAGDIGRAVEVLATRGYRSVVTSALTPLDQAGFVALGFTVRERLHLLVRDASTVPSCRLPEGVRLQRARHHHVPMVLTLDALAFDPFWRLDQHGLDDAIRATPTARFRVVTDRLGGDRSVAGYSIVGRAGRRGYIQRLAVAPARQARGLGRLLLTDAIGWLERRRVTRVMVNTQEANTAALSLYERSGFEQQPGGLAVLTMPLGEDGPATTGPRPDLDLPPPGGRG